jgi:toxin ParE1/3/4
VREISWSEPALADLRALDAWLDEHASPGLALRTLVAIHLRARFLENFPHGGRPVGGDMRVLRVLDTPHLILYRLRKDSVEVLRVHHEREDWQVEL